MRAKKETDLEFTQNTAFKYSDKQMDDCLNLIDFLRASGMTVEVGRFRSYRWPSLEAQIDITALDAQNEFRFSIDVDGSVLISHERRHRAPDAAMAMVWFAKEGK